MFRVTGSFITAANPVAVGVLEFQSIFKKLQF